MGGEAGVVVSINVSQGGVPKRPVPSASVSVSGVDGDGQRDLRHHGGLDRALCLYSAEHLEVLQREGHAVAAGVLGENLTIRGLDWSAMQPGVRLRAGGVTMEITKYASPCVTIRPCFADGDSSRVSQQVNPGWSRVYARVEVAGALRVGDEVTLVPPPLSERP